MRSLKVVQGNTIEEQIRSIDGLFEVILRRDRVMDQKIVRAAQVINSASIAAREAAAKEAAKIDPKIIEVSQTLIEDKSNEAE